MSTQFVSKNANYMIVLKPGMSGNRVLGTEAVPGLYIRFQDGMVVVKDEKIADQLRALPTFGNTFTEVPEEGKDPYAGNRKSIEPEHVTTTMEHGHTGKREGAPVKIELTPQVKKVIEAEALKMIPGLLKSNPDILKQTIIELAKDMKENEETQTDNEVIRDENASSITQNTNNIEPSVVATNSIAKDSKKTQNKGK